MSQVLFLKRHGAHWPGANPELDDAAAAPLLKDGTCIPYTDEDRKRVQAACEVAGPNAEVVTLGPRGRTVADDKK